MERSKEAARKIMMLHKESVNKWREKQNTLGLCRDCKKPATHGCFCKAHREQATKASRAVRKHYRESNLCIICGFSLDSGSSIYCTKHFLHAKKRSYQSETNLSGGMKLLLDTERMDKKELLLWRQKMADVAREIRFQNTLDETEKQIFNLRILSGSISLRALGLKLGISGERVRQVEEMLANKFLVPWKSVSGLNPRA